MARWYGTKTTLSRVDTPAKKGLIFWKNKLVVPRVPSECRVAFLIHYGVEWGMIDNTGSIILDSTHNTII